jgi:Nif-specific regulatory protein
MVGDASDSARAQRECDLYRQLLDLGHRTEIEPFLADALALIVATTGAGRGYLELRDGDGTHTAGAGDPPLFFMARGCSDDDVAHIRTAISRGVIAAAIADGKTIVTASALTDPRFRDRGSVRDNRIEAVFCAPIGAPPLGALYLQDRKEPGPFSEHDRLLAETFARTVGVLADRLLVRRRLRDEADPTIPYRRLLRADGIVGRSNALATLFQSVCIAAPLELDVIITGPSGTGKTRIARLCHDSGPRAAGPFVELNCASLTEALFESELFGHKRGAFTGADSEKSGLVRVAEGGTLFLDEVAEIPLVAQAKLLKFLDSREYYPRGALKPLRADVRIVAATNVDLEAAVKKGTFREDLFHRLHVMPLRMPSIAERRDDIADLVRFFCQRTVEKFKLRAIEPSVGAIRAAEAAEWPGNVRQLVNVVQRAVVLAASEANVLRLERRHLFPEAAAATAQASPSQLTFQDATRAFQAELVQRTLADTDWNVTEAAARLDLTRSHVYNLIRAFGLERKKP